MRARSADGKGPSGARLIRNRERRGDATSNLPLRNSFSETSRLSRGDRDGPGERSRAIKGATSSEDETEPATPTLHHPPRIREDNRSTFGVVRQVRRESLIKLDFVGVRMLNSLGTGARAPRARRVGFAWRSRFRRRRGDFRLSVGFGRRIRFSRREGTCASAMGSLGVPVSSVADRTSVSALGSVGAGASLRSSRRVWFGRLGALDSQGAAVVHLLAPRPSPLAPRPSPLAPRPSPLAPRPSPLAPRPSPLAPRPSPLAPHLSTRVARWVRRVPRSWVRPSRWVRSARQIALIHHRR